MSELDKSYPFENKDGHEFIVYSFTENSDFLQKTIDEYIKLRSECAKPLNEINYDGITILSIDEIKKKIENASIPQKGSGNFDIIRSDFGETAAFLVLEQEFSTKFGYKSVRDRELTQLPGRGIDGIGIENNKEKLHLILSEVKVSDENNSPPQVVDKAKDSLRNQHLSHIIDKTGTKDKIWNTCKRVIDTNLRNDYFLAAIAIEKEDWDKLSIVLTCFLVRPVNKYSNSDFGSFQTSPSDFKPGIIRFLMLCIPDDVNEFINQWYSRIQNRVDQND